MSDDKSKTPSLPNYMSLADDDDDDGVDATIELSLKDVFQFKAQDTRGLGDLEPSRRSAEQQRVEAERGIGMVELEGLELIPLEEDTDHELETPDTSTSASEFEGQDPTTMLDATRWRQPAQLNSQMPTRPSLEALKLPDPDSTSAFEVPDTLLDQVREEFEQERRMLAAARQPKRPVREDDTTRAITLDELREAEAMARQMDDSTRTAELDLDLAPLELQLEFVAAVDENMRLFVPRHLFDEGKLKPGMRLLVTAKVIS